ncbi:MAG: 2-oxoacid:ferredoxin oxidoreductase subunit beta [Planctomycetota bacterium]|nr:2-oxoacid:ferredoxin oxidoreductase subunit beta [Planctomycetota bacterium]
MSVATSGPISLKPADFASSAEVRWCPGCGDYSILATMKRVLAKLGSDRSKTVFVSGIGCSSRFPYYMNTYGFHSIHGRAPTIATGLKLARPELDVWIITGDGDALSIGGNHFIHMLRRNVDAKIILFNNRIYGLTKGQYSPTSLKDQKTKSSPMGSPDYPIRPISMALGAEASFAARTVDSDVRHMESVFERAAKHVGSAFIEVYQNCVIFNDGAYAYAADKAIKAEHTVYLEHGKPLVFGKDSDKGIRLNGLQPEVVSLKDVKADDLLIHDEKAADPTLAFLLSRLRHPEFPEPMGVFRAVEYSRYSELVGQQIKAAVAKKGEGDLQSLLRSNETWTVE